MNDSPAPRPLSGRTTLRRLAIAYGAAALAQAAAIWFELPAWIATTFLVAALALAPIVAVCTARTVSDQHANLSYRERPALTGRNAGALTFVGTVGLAAAIAFFVFPRSWPTRVNDAVALLRAELDEPAARTLAYLGYEDLQRVDKALGASLRVRFGLTTRNFRLAYDCDPEYMHPHTCSSIILSRLWRSIRNELPPEERSGLETLEKQLERVRLRSKQFDKEPLEAFAAFLNDAIREQLQGAELAIAYDPALAQEPVCVGWHSTDTVSLREALALLEERGAWHARKRPPRIELVKESAPYLERAQPNAVAHSPEAAVASSVAGAGAGCGGADVSLP